MGSVTMTRTYRSALALLPGLVASAAAQAQGFPARPVVLVVPYTQGVTADSLARIVAARFAESWKQAVVVENKPGASGIIGTEFVARAAPDGHALLVTLNSFTMAPALFKKLPYDPLADFAPIGRGLPTCAMTTPISPAGTCTHGYLSTE